MGFGFGASDVYTATALALKVYQRCRDSVSEFNDISKEVNVLHMVLEAIDTHWKENELESTTRKNLGVHTEGCIETLHDLEAILDKHKSLGMVKKRKIERLKWVGQNLAPIRTTLINRATYLSIYHDTICSTANSRVIRGLSIRLQETENGKRVSPALSQASHQGLQHDDPETWLNIEEDLVGAGVDAASVSSEHDLIKRFVDNVWAGGDTNDDDSRAQSEEFEEDGPDDYSDGRNEMVGKSRGDATSTQGSKGKINDLQEINSKPPIPKIRSVEDSDPSIIDFQSKDVIGDSEYQNLWDRVIGDKELIRSRGVSAYKRVEALLLSWDRSCSDMSTEMEVEDLKAVFETRFGYHTTVEHLNAQLQTKLQVQLNSKVAMFLDSHDGPDTLLIVYYAGHGKAGKMPGDLEFFGKTAPNEEKKRIDTIVWNKAEKILEDAEADVLGLFDCCHAGQLVGRGPHRLSEFLAACGATASTKPPGKDSFTSALIYALEKLVEERPDGRFTTIDLLRVIQDRAPDFPKDQIPWITDRKKHTMGGRIVLHPLQEEGLISQAAPEEGDPAKRHTVTLHLDFSDKPAKVGIEDLGFELNEFFDRHRFGLNRIRWGGMQCRQATVARAARRLSRLDTMQAELLSSASERDALPIHSLHEDEFQDAEYQVLWNIIMDQGEYNQCCSVSINQL